MQAHKCSRCGIDFITHAKYRTSFCYDCMDKYDRWVTVHSTERVPVPTV